jgi:cytochrome c oxidase subunit I+III
VSTGGAYLVAAGLGLLVFDLIRPKGKRPYAERNPWNAGTLEWLTEMPGKPWGTRSIPVVSSRYPLWDQPDLTGRVDAGEFYLADAPEGKLETLVTTVVEAQPIQCMRVSGPSFLPMTGAAFTGAAFILATFHLYVLAGVSTALAGAAILWWLWRDTAPVPEQEHKDVGLGLLLPIYASGPRSCGWWGMFITMLADVTAFLSLVFAFYYFVAINEDYRLDALAMEVLWPLMGLVGAVAVAATTWAVRRRGIGGATGAGVLAAVAVLACLSGAALLVGPAMAGVAPTSHALAAMIWTLLGWSAVHVALGVVMLLFCAAASMTGRLDRMHDAYLWNTELFWHFTSFTVAVSVLVVLLLPVVP